MEESSRKVLQHLRGAWRGQTMKADVMCREAGVSMRRMHDIVSVTLALGWARRTGKKCVEFDLDPNLYGFQHVTYTARNRVGHEAHHIMRWLLWHGRATYRDLHPQQSRRTRDTFYYARSVLAGLGLVETEGRGLRAVNFAIV